MFVINRHPDSVILDAFAGATDLQKVRCEFLGGPSITGDALFAEDAPGNAVSVCKFTWSLGEFTLTVTRSPHNLNDELDAASPARPALSDAENNLDRNHQHRKNAEMRVQTALPIWEKNGEAARKLVIHMSAHLGRPLPADSAAAGGIAQVVADFQQQIATLRNAAIDIGQAHVTRVDEVQSAAYKKIQERNEELEAEFRQREQTRSAEHDGLRVELNRRLAEVDGQEAKHARRQRRRDLLDQLVSDSLSSARDTQSNEEHGSSGQKHRSPDENGQTSKNLSPTRRRRSGLERRGAQVLFVSGALLVFFVAMETWVAFGSARKGWDLWSMQIGFGLAFGLSATYLLRWLDIRYRHEEEDLLFRRRLSFDINRAEWLVEMLTEYYGTDNKEKPLPPEVIAALSRGLFERVSGAQGAHIADDVAKSIKGTVKVSTGDQVVQIDRS